MKFELKGNFSLAYLSICLIKFCQSEEGKGIILNNEIVVSVSPRTWFVEVWNILDRESIATNDYYGMYIHLDTKLSNEIEIERSHK